MKLVTPEIAMRVFDDLCDGLYFVDKNRVITYWNKAAENISGFTAEEVVGKSCKDNILTHVSGDGVSICENGCPLEATMSDRQPRETTVYMHHKKGHRIPVSVRASIMTDEFNNVIGAVELFTDVSNIEANELRVEELQKLALLDNLTQLANRHYLERELTGRFDEYQRYQLPFGILFIDIDFFKKVNDTYGHDVGDETLKFIADTLITNSRPFDLYGRWGGEEFIGIIKNCSFQALEGLANRIRSLIETSYIMTGNQKVSVTISIGATLIKDGDTIETILKRSDDLLYQSKQNGRNRVTMG